MGGGESGPVGFELTHEDGTTTAFENCFESWPVATSASCNQGATSGSPGAQQKSSIPLVEGGAVRGAVPFSFYVVLAATVAATAIGLKRRWARGDSHAPLV